MQNDYIDVTAAEWTSMPIVQWVPTTDTTQWDQTATFMPVSMPFATVPGGGYEGAYSMGNDGRIFHGGQHYQEGGQRF